MSFVSVEKARHSCELPDCVRRHNAGRLSAQQAASEATTSGDKANAGLTSCRPGAQRVDSSSSAVDLLDTSERGAKYVRRYFLTFTTVILGYMVHQCMQQVFEESKLLNICQMASTYSRTQTADFTSHTTLQRINYWINGVNCNA